MRTKRRRNFIQKEVRSDPRFKTKAHKVKAPKTPRVNPRNWELFEGQDEDLDCDQTWPFQEDD